MQEKVSFSIKGKSYESLPLTAGRTIDFFKSKAYFAGGMYSNMYSDYTSTPEKVLDMVDCKAFMNVFCPKFIEDIKPNNLDDLGISDYMEVVDVYRQTIKPYINDLKELLSSKESK